MQQMYNNNGITTKEMQNQKSSKIKTYKQLQDDNDIR